MEQFAKIPHKMIEQFSGTELKIYGAIDLHCYGNKTACWPGGETLTKYTGIRSRTTISKAKQKLIEGGRLESFRRKETTNLYKLKRPKKGFVAVSWPALLLSGGAFKLYLYLKKSCIENITTIPTAKIKKDCGISDSITLFNYLVELENEDFIEVENLTPERPVNHWCIEKAPEKMDNDTRKTGQCTHEKLNMKQIIRIRLFETDYIMQDAKKKRGTEKQNQPQGQDPLPLPEKNLENFSAEDSEQKSSPQKNGNTDFRPLNNKQRRKIRKQEGRFSKQEWAMLLDAYEKKLTDKQKAIVNEYIDHELQLYDADPMNKDRETETRKFLICEFLSKQRRQIPERYKKMTPEQRQAELENDPIAKHRKSHIENYTPPVDETDLLAIWRNQYKPLYEKQM